MTYRKILPGAKQSPSKLIHTVHLQNRFLNSLSRDFCYILLHSLNLSLVSNNEWTESDINNEI